MKGHCASSRGSVGVAPSIVGVGHFAVHSLASELTALVRIGRTDFFWGAGADLGALAFCVQAQSKSDCPGKSRGQKIKALPGPAGPYWALPGPTGPIGEFPWPIPVLGGFPSTLEAGRKKPG